MARKSRNDWLDPTMPADALIEKPGEGLFVNSTHKQVTVEDMQQLRDEAAAEALEAMAEAVTAPQPGNDTEDNGGEE